MSLRPENMMSSYKETGWRSTEDHRLCSFAINSIALLPATYPCTKQGKQLRVTPYTFRCLSHFLSPLTYLAFSRPASRASEKRRMSTLINKS
jgi:hypothetical protein